MAAAEMNEPRVEHIGSFGRACKSGRSGEGLCSLGLFCPTEPSEHLSYTR